MCGTTCLRVIRLRGAVRRCYVDQWTDVPCSYLANTQKLVGASYLSYIGPAHLERIFDPAGIPRHKRTTCESLLSVPTNSR